MHTLRGILGIGLVLLAAYLLSNNRGKINWRPVLGGLAIQFCLAFTVLKWEVGRQGLMALTEFVQKVYGAADEGIGFVFGPLSDMGTMGEVFGSHFAFVFAFRVLPLVIFFASLISVLYYLGIMQLMIRWIGGGLQKVLGTTKEESMAAAANIFVGQSEAPLVIRPYLSTMTQSGLFAVMSCGLASVAGTTLGGYAAMGVPLEYLLAASFMAAPAGLAMAKLMFPEEGDPAELEKGEDPGFEKDDTANIVDAAAKGASDGLGLAMNIGAMILAFVSLIALVNILLGALAGQTTTTIAGMLVAGIFIAFAGWRYLSNPLPLLVIGGTMMAMAVSGHFGGTTLQQILGWVFSPVAWAIGIPWEDAQAGGNYIGQKVVLNEFVAYAAFISEMDNLSPKTHIVVSFALCGFANLGSMAINLGALGKLAPSRRAEVAKIVPKALLAGLFASFLSASMAGMFYR